MTLLQLELKIRCLSKYVEKNPLSVLFKLTVHGQDELVNGPNVSFTREVSW